MLESEIQKEIFKYLKIMNIFGFSIPNEASNMGASGKTKSNKFAIINKLKSMGLRSGMPDLAIVKNGVTYYFEVKTQKGKLSNNQLKTFDELSKENINVTVVRSLQEFINSLRNL